MKYDYIILPVYHIISLSQFFVGFQMQIPDVVLNLRIFSSLRFRSSSRARFRSSAASRAWSTFEALAQIGFRIMADVGQIFQRRVGAKSCDHHDSEDEGHAGDNGEDKNDEGRQRQQSRTTECCNRQETQSQNPGG